MWMQIVLVLLRLAAAATLGVMSFHVTKSWHLGDATGIIIASVLGGNLGPLMVDEVMKLVRSKA